MHKINIYGGGPAAMILALELSNSPQTSVSIYEKNKTLGRKFLVAGKGGFNLSHDGTLEFLKSNYWPEGFMDSALDCFDNSDLRLWFKELGIETFVGSSRRIFPISGTKPIHVLQAILKKLDQNNVRIITNHEFIGFKYNNVLVSSESEITSVSADTHVFALGGASWKVTGSSGSWSEIFKSHGISVVEFKPSNCGLELKWNSHILKNHVGKPLKNIAIGYKNSIKMGEAVITYYGLEGNAIYPHASKVGIELEAKNNPILTLDFRPSIERKKLYDIVINCNLKLDSIFKNLKLKTHEIAIIKNFTSKASLFNASSIVESIRKLEIPVNALRPMDEAISTTGGIDIAALDKSYMLVNKPNHYCIGEMVNWDTVTGGFLLQGCLSQGYFLAKTISNSIEK